MSGVAHADGSGLNVDGEHTQAIAIGLAVGPSLSLLAIKTKNHKPQTTHASAKREPQEPGTNAALARHSSSRAQHGLLFLQRHASIKDPLDVDIDVGLTHLAAGPAQVECLL